MSGNERGKTPPILMVCNDKGIQTEIEFEEENREDGGGSGFQEILKNVGKFSLPFGKSGRSKRFLVHLIEHRFIFYFIFSQKLVLCV